MASLAQPTNRASFHIAIICVLPCEFDAIALLFDHFWDESGDLYGRTDGDSNTYITGRIGQHDAVLTMLPGMGTSDAAAATASLRSSYRNLRLAIITGICGGVPSISGYDAFLGDVVVSKAIIRYDCSGHYSGHFAAKGGVEDTLGRPNNEIRGLLAIFQTELVRERLQTKATEHLRHLQQVATQKRRRANYRNPGPQEDKLYSPGYRHQHQTGCDICLGDTVQLCESASKASCIELGCDETNLITREGRVQNGDYVPEIFIGRVGSGNTVMKSGKDRDRISTAYDVIAFEMEGAGAWDQVSCIVVKGICDYADSHKNKKWQDFAAATAASVMKAILEKYPASSLENQGQSKNLRGSDHGATSKMNGRNISQNSFGSNTKINQGDAGRDMIF